MKAYFDRTNPVFLSPNPSFEGVEVEVPGIVFNVLASREETQRRMAEAIDNAGAPEDSAQTLADLYVDLLEAERG